VIASELYRKPLVLTLGDPAGIGPEITAKAWLALKNKTQCAFAIIAPLRVMEKAMQDIGGPKPKAISELSDVTNIFANNLPVLPLDGRVAKAGKPSPDNAMTITESIERAVGRALSGEAAGIVTNPISKDILYQAGFTFPGHTEYLGDLTATSPAPYARGPVMMLAGGGLRVGLVTVHLPLKDAAEQLSSDAILNNARVINGALKCDFGIKNPRIALAGLNPHAGEGGALGMEERNIINPTARVLREEGLDVTDAQPADTLFHTEAREGYDAVLAMYHDQGLIPVKTLDFHGGVNITLGLPIVRTSPDHGTAFGIAGQNKARPDSLIAAIKTAREIANNRERYVT